MNLTGNTIYPNIRVAPEYPPRLGTIIQEPISMMTLRLKVWNGPTMNRQIGRILATAWGGVNETAPETPRA